MAAPSPPARRLAASVSFIAALASALVLWAPSASAATARARSGQTFSSLVRGAKPGDVIQFPSGTWPRQLLQGVHVASPGVTLVGDSRTGTVVKGLELWDSSGIRVRNMTVTGTAT